MKNTFLFTLFILACCIASAQQAEKKKKSGCGCSFNSILQVGMLEGSAGSSFQVQSINGFRFGRVSTGIGIGLDKYRLRSLPVFFDLRTDLSKKPNTAFVFGDIGINYPWVVKGNNGFWGTRKYDRGIYYDAGAGYKFNVGKSRSLIFSAGYSMKKMRETQYMPAICDFGPCPALEGERFDFTLKRFSLKAGLQL
jgi:hypothetical protein